MAKRFWEVDALRGLALIAMIASNGLFDLVLFRNALFNVQSGPLLFLARATAIAFVALLGLSLHLRAYRRPLTSRALLRRAAQFLALGLVITAITLAAFPQSPILFGILHFAAAATLLCSPLIRRPREHGRLSAAKSFIALALASPLILAGLWISSAAGDGLRHALGAAFLWLLPLGLAPAGYAAFDYFALLPWLGVAFAGLFAGAQLYPRGARAFHFPETTNRGALALAWLGRHSLLVYFLHQPILVALLVL